VVVGSMRSKGGRHAPSCRFRALKTASSGPDLTRAALTLAPPMRVATGALSNLICCPHYLDDLSITERGGEDRDREDALPVYRVALEESRNAFSDLMAEPEKTRRNALCWALPRLASQSSASPLGGQLGYSGGSCRLERWSLSWAWSSVRRTSRCHEN
jgi:hypothetical protein